MKSKTLSELLIGIGYLGLGILPGICFIFSAWTFTGINLHITTSPITSKIVFLLVGVFVGMMGIGLLIGYHKRDR